MNQAELAKKYGVSQAQVSRRIKKILQTLKMQLEEIESIREKSSNNKIKFK